MTAATRSRGRPRKFDEEAVLDTLTALFWQHGYEATSMADIVEASGLNKSSLYNTFGSKQQLFATVLARYIDTRACALADLVDASGDGIEGMHTFLDAIRAELDGDFGRQGCLAVNTSAEVGGGDDAIKEFGELYRSRMRDALSIVVTKASDKSGLDPHLIEPRTDMLLMFMLGLSLSVRAGAGDDEIDRLFAAAHSTVDSWRP